ncbi:MAG: acyltransferase family protein [Phycisphaerae bacterium]|nr:acyltransferase family protein [Phycisphaerae bacterium]
MKDPARTSFPYVDQLRVLASLAVILIHVTLGSLETVTPLSTTWWLGHWICLVSQWAVPVFVMISGALLLNPQLGASESPACFYQKRLRRIGWPLIFWTAFYFVVRLVCDHEPVTAGYVLDHLLRADPPYHTYFLFLITGLYGVTPLLRVLIRHTSSSQRQGLILLIFALASAYAMANAWLWGNGRFLFSFFLPYLGYYLCGYELTQLSEDTLTRRHWAWAVGLSILYLVMITPPYVDNLGRQNGRFVLGSFSLPVIAMSVGIFRAAWQRDHQAVKSSQDSKLTLATRIAPATFGIYLVHVAVLVGLREALKENGLDNPFLVNVMIGTVIAFGLSHVLTVVMQKVPVLKRLV